MKNVQLLSDIATQSKIFLPRSPEIKKAIKTIEQRLAMIRQRYEDRQTRIGKKCKEMEERRKRFVVN